MGCCRHLDLVSVLGLYVKILTLGYVLKNHAQSVNCGYSAASVPPQSAADFLIRSALDISHPRQQGNPPASSSAASGPVRSDIINGLRTGTVGGDGNPSLFCNMTTGVVPGPVDCVSTPPSSGRGNNLPTQSQTSYHSA